MTILISACLLGLETRYDGRGKAVKALMELAEKHTLVPVCPEQLGGMPTPRVACERLGDKVVSIDGQDKTEAFHQGARLAREIGRISRCEAAVLKSKSPSCGLKQVYDGSFNKQLVDGKGVFAELMAGENIPLFTENELDSLYAWLEQNA